MWQRPTRAMEKQNLSGRYSHLLNIALRMTTLAIRFLLVFFLARFLDPASVGYYGLFTATIGFVIYFIGLDFYVYTTREVVKLPAEERAGPVKAQAVLSFGLYVLVLPIVVIILEHLGWPRSLIWWFLPIVILEHINQEIFRLLVALSQQVVAGILMFIRQGSWALAVVALMAARPETRSLEVLMALWAGTGVITVILGVFCIRRQDMGRWNRPVNWSWVFTGIKISAAFLIATLSLRAVQTVDRYMLEYLDGIESVAPYVLFLGMAAVLLTFLDAGVFAFSYPKLIALHNRGDTEGFRQQLRQTFIQTAVFCVIFAGGSALVLPYLLAWIGNPVYSEAISIYPLLLLAMILNALGMVPHYALYARHRDRTIIHSHLAALPAFLISAWIMGQIIPHLAVPAALAMSFALILLWKALAYWRISGGATEPLSDKN